jgi:hypothetical protein
MKKILLVLFCFLLAFVVKAQTFPISQNIGSKTTIVRTTGTFGTTTGFTFLELYPDTTAFNELPYVPAQPGILMMTSDYKLWVRNTTANKWEEVSGGGEEGDLQTVTDLGNYTTNKILSSNGFGTRDTLTYVDFWLTGTKYAGGIQDRQFTNNPPYTNDTSVQIGFTQYGPLAGYRNRYQTIPTANTFIGAGAGRDVVLSGNTVVGQGGLMRGDSTFRNTVIGLGGLQFTRYGDENTAIGTFALEVQTGVSGNVAVGSNAARGNKMATGITAIGSYSLVLNTTGVDSVVMTNSGHGCSGTPSVTFSAPVTYNRNGTTINGTPGAAVTTATGTAIMDGSDVIGVAMINPGAGYSTQLAPGVANTVTFSGGGCSVTPTATVVLKSGNNNTALGTDVLRANTIGQNNVGIGYRAGYGAGGSEASVTDDKSVFVGPLASRSSSRPNTNPLTNVVAIGYNAKVATSNTIVLGNSDMDSAHLFGVAPGASTDSVMTYDPTTKQVKDRDASAFSGGGSTTIYTGDGSISGNRFVDVSGKSLTFGGIFSFLTVDDADGDIEAITSGDFSVQAGEVKLLTDPGTTYDTTNNKILVRNQNTGKLTETHWPVSSGGTFDPDLAVISALGSAIKYEPYGTTLGNLVNQVTLADGQVNFIPVYISEATTITGVKWVQGTAGNYTADNYNGVGLYSYSGGTLTLVASSSDDGNIWKQTSGSMGAKAFSSTYNASPGLYYIAFLYNNSAQTTAPVVRGGVTTTTPAVTADFTNSAKLFGLLGSQNSLPGTQAMSGVATTTNTTYGALY